MKKVGLLLGIILIVGIVGVGGYFVYTKYFSVSKISVEEERVSVSEYYVYGNHLNMKGNLSITDMSYKDIMLVLEGEEEKEIKILASSDGNSIDFSISEYINDGLYLDDMALGKYCLFLKLIYENEENADKPIVKYYALNNETEYSDTTYYTLSKYGNKILVNFDNEYQTMAFNVTKNSDKNIYDVTIDPGHGGMDGGGSTSQYREAELTMEISKKVREYLEENNIKVKMTHEDGELGRNDLLDEYGEHGRAVIPNEVKSKYTISIHVNKNASSNVNGFEIYTAANINYDFAKSIAEELVQNSGIGYSTNRLYKIFNGIYTRNFTDSEVANSLEEYNQKNYKPYNISTKANYYYMIRETGGYITGAYVDDSNSEHISPNPFYNSNIGNESYLLELGYISNASDIKMITENVDGIAKAIANALVAKINK